MLNKDKVIETIKQLPDNFQIEELFERILLLEKIERGLEQSTQGKITPDEELEDKLPKWLA
ncbi:MAG: hypothetical protein WAU21_10755 [Chitinophagales bacterium]|nr:hypothetical protein [Bacteroidota bacterium]MBK8488933.1 hypothetical protein [Bacteroidota bacterium]MBK8680781.1 hypothetical protein [Bacteroidota bacterium]